MRRFVVAALLASSLVVVGAGGTAAVASAAPPTPPNDLRADTTQAPQPTSPYPIPSGHQVSYVATTGNDSTAVYNDATHPFRTIAGAVASLPPAPSGFTPGSITDADWPKAYVVVGSGIYYEGDIVTDTAFVLQPAANATVTLDGTADVVTGYTWTSDGAGHWTLPWNTGNFCGGGYYNQVWPYQHPGTTVADGPCQHADNARATDPNPVAGDPQMMFLGNQQLTEKATRAQVTGTNTFYYDFPTKSLVIGFNPAGTALRATKHANALLIDSACNGDTTAPGSWIRGVDFRRYATNENQDAQGRTHGALDIACQPNVQITDDLFTENAAAGLHLLGAAARNALLQHNVFANNGHDGAEANGNRGSVQNLQVLNNLFLGNNTEMFGTSCIQSCNAAALKMAHMAGVTVENNIIEGTNGVASGVWCDLACSNAKIVYNTVDGNGDFGIFYEVSDTAIIASNTVYANGGTARNKAGAGQGNDLTNKGGGIRVGSANTTIMNNSLYQNSAGIEVYDDERSAPADGDSYTLGPDTADLDIRNNIIAEILPRANGVTSDDDFLFAAVKRLKHCDTTKDPNCVDPPTGGTSPDGATFFAATSDSPPRKAMEENSWFRAPGGSSTGTPRYLAKWNGSDAKASTSTTLSYTSASALAAAKSVESVGRQDYFAGQPLFTDPAHGNFAVRSDSPAYSAPIATLPQSVLDALHLTSSTGVRRGALTP